MVKGLANWYRQTISNWFFRSFIGPAQTKGAIHGADAMARDRWKQDLAARKRYSREQRERRRERLG